MYKIIEVFIKIREFPNKLILFYLYKTNLIYQWNSLIFMKPPNY